VENLPSLTLDEIVPIAATMRRSAENLYTLLQNLLEWSMMQGGLIVYNAESVQLSNMIAPILDSVRHAADKKMLRISSDFPANIRVVADEHMFASLMRNLIVNAIKFTPKGGHWIIRSMLTPLIRFN
jgi:signal transduction histidine kinase